MFRETQPAYVVWIFTSMDQGPALCGPILMLVRVQEALSDLMEV